MQHKVHRYRCVALLTQKLIGTDLDASVFPFVCFIIYWKICK